MTLDELLEYTEIIKKDIKKINLHEDDVRYSFFGLYYSAVYDYYIGKAFFQIAKYIGDGEIKFTERIYPFEPHARRLYEIQDHELLVQGYHGNLNRNVLFSVWTSFELVISLIFEHIITEKDFEEIVLKLNEKVIKAIRNIDEEVKKVIIETLNKTSFIPINRKFNYIINHNKSNYLGNIEEDRKFLDFVIKLRNCMIHSNGVYHGSEFYYKFGDDEFLFKNKEMLLQNGPNQSEVYLHIAIKIKEIFESIISLSLSHL